MTLRFRLTFWNTVMLALVLAIFALAFHTFVANTLYNQLEATIRSQAEQVVQIFQSGIDPSRLGSREPSFCHPRCWRRQRRSLVRLRTPHPTPWACRCRCLSRPLS